MTNHKQAQSREDKAHSPKNRPDRIPLGQGSKLDVPACYKKPGMHYHWFIDRPGELEGAAAAWYEFVKDDQGKKITTPAGRGETHFLMCIDQETYLKDMAKQQEMVTNTTRQNVAVKKERGEYSPEGNDLAVSREII